MRPDTIDARALIAEAAALARPVKPSNDVATADVAAAILSGSGWIYTGVCVDSRCSLGFCAEHAAVAEMLKARESHVKAVIAVDAAGQILPPCGRCRELLWQMDVRIRDAEVFLGPNQTVCLAGLLPRPSNRGRPAQ